MANLNKLKKYHFIYKTVNLINNKFYIGMHSTNNLNDGYLGSGKRLRRSVNKYGKENFRLEVLEFFESRELLVEREKQLVNEELLKDSNCMNLKPGGTGGWSNEAKKRGRILGNKKHNLLLKINNDYRKSYCDKMRIKMKHNYDNGKCDNFIEYRYNWVGKTHREDTKQKMSEAKKGKGTKENNSQFGTMWITNGTENKKIKKEEIIPTGWRKGRILKNNDTN